MLATVTGVLAVRAPEVAAKPDVAAEPDVAAPTEVAAADKPRDVRASDVITSDVAAAVPAGRPPDI